MGKGSKKRRSTPRTGKGHARDEEVFIEEEIDDEIDAFHKQREMIPLDISKDVGNSDDDSEEPVFDLEGYENEDNELCGEASHDEDEDGFDDFVKAGDKGFTAKIARQAKYLKEKFGGGEDEMSEDDEEGNESKAVWGRQKNLYYSADNVDYELQSSDEDLPIEEEAEVLKIQQEKAKSLLMEDFGLDSSGQEKSDSDGERTFQELASEKAIGKPAVDSGIHDDVTLHGYEEIKKDLNDLSKEEQMDIVYSTAPELVSLLSELKMSVGQLEEAKTIVSKVGMKGNDKISGMDYFKVKHIVLLTYCQAISFYLLLKSEGHPVRDHPVIARLVEIKNLWEKMKHISSKFPSQVEDAVNQNFEFTRSNGEHVPMEPETGLMNITTNALAAPEGPGSVKDGVQDVDSKGITKKHQDPPRDLISIEMMKLRENLEAKLRQKGIYNFIQENASKEPKDLAKPTKRNLERTSDFDDEVRQADERNVVVDKNRPRLNRIAQAVVVKTNGRKVVSGDVDLPKRDDIAARRRKHELRVLARAGVTSMEGSDEDGEVPVGGDCDTDLLENDGLESEDDFYRKVKKQRAEKLKAKSQLYSRAQSVSMEEAEADGKRHISVQMEKNRGLTRNRKKLTKNPRKKYKIKHQKAVTRRKGQVREARKPSGPYGGEATGININVSRSIRFKN